MGIDYTAAPGHAPGVGRYVRELVRALIRLPEGVAPPLRLVEVGRGPRPMEGAPLGLEGAEVTGSIVRSRLRLPRRAAALVGRIPGAARALVSAESDLFHRVHAGWPPIGAVPSTLAVAEFPQPASLEAATLADAARAADGVLTFSSSARDRLVRDAGVDPERVHVAPVGTEHWERDVSGPSIPRPSRDVLVLGAIRHSRAPLDVLRAFEALLASGEHARLLLVGRAGDAAGDLRAALTASPARGSVRWIDNPDEARMPGCVGGASVLLHLAEDEATAVTPLEAARSGLPVVASPLPAFQEALGDGARWVDGDDPAQVAASLREALGEADDGAARDAQRDRAGPYTWRACAEAHVRAWDSILGARASR